MHKQIVDTYVRKMTKENIDHLVNVLHIALNGNAQQSKSLILELLLEELNIIEENNEMEVPFEPADQHISVRITPTEKRIFIKWCIENRLTKSQGIRKLINEIK